MKTFLRVLLASVILVGAMGMFTTPAKAETFSSYVSGVTMQNLSGAEATVNVVYYDQSGVEVASVSDTIAAYGVKDYSVVPVTSPFKGSAVISSSAPVSVVSTLRGDNKGRGAYVGFSEGATNVVLPVLMKNWGSSLWNTWFSVQNVGTADADISVDYAACSGTADATATGVKPGAMAVFSQKDEPCFTGTKTMTSAAVSSTQPLVVVVAQESSVVNSSLVSSGFGAGDTNPVIPLVNSNNPDSKGWRTAISVYNMGTSATDVTLTYVKAADGTSCTEKQTIDANTSKTFAGNNLITTPPAGVETTCTMGAKLVGSAYVSANSTSQPLVATVNQDRGSLASAYGALSPSSASPKVVFPQIQDRNGSTSQWASSFMVMNVGSASTFVKCTFANTTVTAESGEIASYKAWESLQRGLISEKYVGSGECTAYTDNTYTTVDTAAKIVAVVNVRGTGVGLFDLMMSYEGMNVVP